MRLIGRILLCLTVGIVVLLVGLLVAVVVIVHTDRFREWLRVQIVAAVDPLFPATVTIGALEGSVFGTLTARDVAIRYAGADVVRVERAAVSHSLRGLLHGAPPRVGLELERPVVCLVQSPDGQWNIVAAFATPPAPPQPAAPSPGWLAVDLAPINLRDGLVTVRTADAPIETLRVEHLAIDATAAIRPAGIAASVHTLTAGVASAGVPPLQLRAAARYDGGVSPSLVTIQSAAVQTEHSTVLVEGRVQDLEAPMLDLTATVMVAAAEVRQLAGVALRPDVTGTVSVTGPLPALRAALTLAAGGATVSAEAHADVAADPPRYDARATLAGIELRRLLDGEIPGGVLAGTVDAAGVGTDLATVRAHGSVTAQGLSWQEQALGNVDLSATLAGGSVTFTTEARGGSLPVRLGGTVRLGDPLGYQLAATVRQLDPARLPGGRAGLKGSIDVDATVDGSGTDLATLAARLSVDLLPSSVGPIQLTKGRVRASVARQQVRIDELRLAAPATTLAVSGDLGMEANASGRLVYDLRVTDVGPWMRLAAQRGSGALTLHGTLTGNLEALRVDGNLDVQTLTVAGVQMHHGAVGFDLAGVQSGTPSGTVSAAVQGLEAGLAFERIDARIGLAAGTPATAAIDLTARDVAQRTQRAQARVTYGGAETVVRLNEVALETPAGPWQLARPATIRQSPTRLVIDDFRLENGPQYLSVDGQVAPTLALEAHAVDFDLAVLNAVSSRDVTDIAGRLDLDLALTGATDRPVARGSIRLRDGAARLRPLGVQVTAATAQVGLDEHAVRIEEVSAKAGDGVLSATGTIGIRDYQPDTIDVSLRLDEWPAIDTSQSRATLAADLRADGTVSAPAVRGRVDVLRASLRPDLGFLGRQSLTRDPTIIVVGRPDAAADTLVSRAPVAGLNGPPDIYKNLLIDVTVGIARNSWVRHPDAVIELTGAVRADKPRGGELVLDGDIQTVRGWVAFRGRRFRIQEGEVRFTGATPIDPSFDVVASHQFTDYRVEVVIGGTARTPMLTLRSDPTLEQADILALIIFGRPVGQLFEGERQNLQAQALEVAGSFAAQELGRSISDALGLDHLGIDIRQVDIRGGTVGFGTYLTEKTYVAIDQDISGRGGTKATIEYSITPNWQVQTSTSSAGNSEGGILWRKRY